MAWGISTPGSNDSGTEVTTWDLSNLSITRKVKAPEFRTPNKMVTFHIGEEEEEFIVHKEHACRYSPMLDKAFNSEFLEGQTQQYKIDDTTPSAFRFFVQWLYTQKLGHISILDDYDPLMTDEEKRMGRIGWYGVTSALLELWVLAGKLLLPQLQNEVMDLLNRIGSVGDELCVTSLQLRINYIYEYTTPDSPLRRFVASWMAWSLYGADYKKYPNLYPIEFLLDLATIFSYAVPPRAVQNQKSRMVSNEFYVEEDS